jgi:hypothetical protein
MFVQKLSYINEKGKRVKYEVFHTEPQGYGFVVDEKYLPGLVILTGEKLPKKYSSDRRNTAEIIVTEDELFEQLEREFPRRVRNGLILKQG